MRTSILLALAIALVGQGWLCNSVLAQSVPPRVGAPDTCTFEVFPTKPEYSYAADFYLSVRNISGKKVRITHNEGPPFRIIFRCKWEDYPLKHKREHYVRSIGGTRGAEEVYLDADETTGFPVDLKGDFVVGISKPENLNESKRYSEPETILFRDFAAGKSGEIIIECYDYMPFATEINKKEIKWNGKSVVIRAK